MPCCPIFIERYGNPSSLHTAGRLAREAVEEARRTIAQCIGSLPEEVVFTSGGTEANNLAVKGIAFPRYQTGRHIIISAIEHDCVLNAALWLRMLGFKVDLLPVDETGIVLTSELDRMIRTDTILVR